MQSPAAPDAANASAGAPRETHRKNSTAQPASPPHRSLALPPKTPLDETESPRSRSPKKSDRSSLLPPAISPAQMSDRSPTHPPPSSFRSRRRSSCSTDPQIPSPASRVLGTHQAKLASTASSTTSKFPSPNTMAPYL